MYRFEIKKDPKTGEPYVPVALRGAELLSHPVFTKGTAFPPGERDTFGLRGLGPGAIGSLEEQARRSFLNYQAKESDLQRYIFLNGLQDRNETVFYRLLLDHLEEMMPIVYTPTVGEGCRRYSEIFRRPRGLFLTYADLNRVEDVLRNAPFEDVRLIVVTDGERILGLGDLGAGGMGIPIGKISLYVALAGLHPSQTLPICIDVGTNNPRLLDDPLYVGVREQRLRGAKYDELLEAFVQGVRKVFPRCVIQWEDFDRTNAFRLHEQYKEQVPSFDDDIQGTGCVALSALRGAMRLLDRKLRHQTFVLVGKGQAGTGIALQILAALDAAGIPRSQAKKQFWMVGRKGLVLNDAPGLEDYERDLGQDPAEIQGWKLEKPGEVSLLDVIRNTKPHVLIGTSGIRGVFNEEVVKTMGELTERPVIFALSNPTANTECTPEEAIQWTDGRAIVATGSPFAPVIHNGRTHAVSQANNAYVFPGVGLGAIVSEARTIPDQMFLAASRALADLIPADQLSQGCILPPLTEARKVSAAVALAAARAARDSGAGLELSDEEYHSRIQEAFWEPSYLPYRPSP